MTQIRMRARSRFDRQSIRRKTRRTNIENLSHAGGAVRLAAVRSIKRRKGKSPAGRPPHTRRGQLRRATRYQVEKQRGRVVIGPKHSVVGQSATAHEYGGTYKRQRYQRRPFMGPAMEKIRPRLPRLWRDSIR